MNRLFLRGLPVLLLLAVLAAPSCKTARSAATDEPALKERSSRFLLKKLVQQQFAAEWFSARAKIDYEDEYEKTKFTGYIRLRRDSAIWMVFKKLSVEAARVLITPDSVYVIDRINNQYAIKDFAYLQRAYRFPADFQGLQTLLLGNPIFFTTDLAASIDGQRYALQGQTTDRANAYMLDGLTYLLRELVLADLHTGRSLQYSLSGDEPLEDQQNFSYFRSVVIRSPDLGDVSVDIEFSKVEINVPKNLQFEIPDRYTKID